MENTKFENREIFTVVGDVATVVGEISGFYSIVTRFSQYTLNSGKMDFMLVSDSEGTYLVERLWDSE